MALGKPAWFKVEPAAFLSDVQIDAMTTLELGACFRLLCRQWLDSFIPDNAELLARLSRLDTGEMAEAWPTLSRFFPVIEKGKRANRFMWVEREKVVTELERRSDEGTRAARKRWDFKRQDHASPNGSPMPDPMQEKSRVEKKNPSSEQSSDQEFPSQKKSPSQPDVRARRLAALLKSQILNNKPDYRITEAQLRKWEITADRMLRLDGRSAEEIEALLRWAQNDSFWMTNVLSMDTLREKFDQLQLKAGKANPSTLSDSYMPASEKIRRERLKGAQ